MPRTCKRLEPPESQALPDWAFAGQIFARERLVHHRDVPCVLDLRLAEGPPFLERDSQHAKIFLADELKQGLRLLRVRFSGDFHPAFAATIRRKVARRRRTHHSRQGLHPREQRPEESGRLVRVLVAVPGQGQHRPKHLIRAHAEIDVPLGDKTPHQQSRTDQQRQRQRDFHHHQRVTERPAAEPAADALAAVAQRIVDVTAGRLQRRRQTKDQRRQHRHAQRERQHRQIQLDHRLGRDQVRRHRRHEQRQSARGDEDAQHGPGHRQHQALDHEQPDESHAPGSQRRAQGELLLAGRRPRQYQMRHVAARDQQEQSHRGQHRVQGGLEGLVAAQHRIKPRSDTEGEMRRVELRITLRQAAGDDRQVRLRLLGRQAPLQASQQEPSRCRVAEPRLRLTPQLLGNPHVRAVPGKARRHDADQRPAGSIQDERRVQNRRIAVEPGHPCLVAHHEHRRRPRLVVARLHHPTVQCRHPEELERARRHERSLELLGAFSMPVHHPLAGCRDDPVERTTVFGEFQKFRRGVSLPPALLALLILDPRKHHALRALLGKGRQQHVVDHAENRRRRADAQAQGGDRHRREPAVSPQGAPRVSQVVPPRLDRGERLQRSAVLLQQRGVAELATRCRCRRFPRHAVRHESFGQLPQMLLDFVFDPIGRVAIRGRIRAASPRTRVTVTLDVSACLSLLCQPQHAAAPSLLWIVQMSIPVLLCNIHRGTVRLGRSRPRPGHDSSSRNRTDGVRYRTARPPRKIPSRQLTAGAPVPAVGVSRPPRRFGGRRRRVSTMSRREPPPGGRATWASSLGPSRLRDAAKPGQAESSRGARWTRRRRSRCASTSAMASRRICRRSTSS